MLGATSSVSFFLTRTGTLPGGGLLSPPGEIDDTGAAYLRSSKIAENNHALPRDRVSFRYNHFANAREVKGFTLEGARAVPQLPGAVPPFATLPSPLLGFDLIVPLPPELVGQPFPPVIQVQTASRSYDVDMYTFQAERTFVNGLFSVDVRVPFATTLSSHLDLSTGAAQETGAGLFDVTPTPFQSLGTEATEFGNVTAILKMLIHESPSTIFSGGFGVNAPTGRDSRIAVTDYFGFLLDFTAADVGSPVPGPRFLDLGLETQRSRLFEIDNEAWSVSPFLSVAHAPPERWFTNGFLQIEAPLNQNSVRYRRKYRFAEPITLTELSFGGTGVLDDVAAEFELQEQTLLHCDVGTGYWLYRNPCAPRIRGLAGLMELHYTTTLNDADVAVIPGEPGTLRPIASIEQQAFVPQTQTAVIGNAANRLDILNLTAGTTLLLGDRTTIATAVVVPLRDGADKLFDLEFNLQLNYFPGSLSNLNFGS